MSDIRGARRGTVEPCARKGVNSLVIKAWPRGRIFAIHASVFAEAGQARAAAPGASVSGRGWVAIINREGCSDQWLTNTTVKSSNRLRASL